MDGWVTWHRQTEDGAVESEQRVALSGPVVEFSSAGGVELGSAYWREVRRATRSLVRAREASNSLELRLLGSGPTLLRFGPPTVEATETLVSCTYSIEGGLLARQPSGKITFEQTGGPFAREAPVEVLRKPAPLQRAIWDDADAFISIYAPESTHEGAELSEERQSALNEMSASMRERIEGLP